MFDSVSWLEALKKKIEGTFQKTIVDFFFSINNNAQFL